MSQSTTPGVNDQGVIDQANPDMGIFEFDIVITSTLLTALQIELFNSECSVFEVVNPGVNNYVPVAPFYMGAAAQGQGQGAANALKATVANSYLGGVIVGSNDFFINAGGVVPLGTTSNICYFDMSGNAIWQPGYLNGAQVAGNVVVSCSTANSNYRHIHEWTKKKNWLWHSGKFEFSEVGQVQSPIIISTRNVVGTTGNKSINMKGAKTNTQFNPLLMTPKINTVMRPCNGWRYNVLPSTLGNGVPMTITANLFWSLKSALASAAKGVDIYTGDTAL